MIPLLLRANNASAWTGETGNNTWLFTGSVAALIDAGVGDAAHVEAIATALGGDALASVLVTHGHADHCAGLPALTARWPSLRVMRFPELRDGNIVPAGDGRLRAIHTPGHAPDHVCLFDGESGDLYCGDLVRAGGTIVIPASKGGNLREYLASLQRVRALAPKRLLPGHGPIIDNPAAAIDQYVRHRAQREEQVIAALRTGARTPSQIVAEIYGDLPASLAAAAADSVLAHLVKLQEEGRATPAATPSEATAGAPNVSPPSAWRLG